MPDQKVEVLGYVAATLTTVSFVPQVLQVYRTRSTRDVSLGMFLLFTAGVIAWLVYGILLNSYPVMACNGATLVLAGAILVAKLRWG